MKRSMLLVLALFLLAPLPAIAGGLDEFLGSVNIEARADMPGFSAKLSTQFGVPIAQVQTVIHQVPEPADAFMIFQLGQMSGRQPDTVLGVYGPNKKKGWGAIAKELGIKPGSPEFHALKSGDLYFTGQPVSSASPGKGKGKEKHGKGKGHNK
jgi:hypothetical protein